MKNKETQIDIKLKEWIRKAYDDELNARSILKHRDGTPSGVCFLSQQMAEKLFKVVLILKQERFPKIHNLLKLLEIIIKFDNDFRELKKSAIILNEFYITSRYPDDLQEFSWEDAEEAFEATEKIKKFVLNKIKVKA